MVWMVNTKSGFIIFHKRASIGLEPGQRQMNPQFGKVGKSTVERDHTDHDSKVVSLLR